MLIEGCGSCRLTRYSSCTSKRASIKAHLPSASQSCTDCGPESGLDPADGVLEHECPQGRSDQHQRDLGAAIHFLSLVVAVVCPRPPARRANFATSAGPDAIQLSTPSPRRPILPDCRPPTSRPPPVRVRLARGPADRVGVWRTTGQVTVRSTFLLAVIEAAAPAARRSGAPEKGPHMLPENAACP